MTKFLHFRTDADGTALTKYHIVNSRLNIALGIPSLDGKTLTATQPSLHSTQGELWLVVSIPQRFQKHLTAEQVAKLTDLADVLQLGFFPKDIAVKLTLWERLKDFFLLKR